MKGIAMETEHPRIYKGPVKAIILDLAGTTVDYGSRAPAGAFIDLFARHDIEITMEQARAPMGLQKREHIREIALMPEVSAKWIDKHGRECDEDDIDAMYHEFVPLQVESLPHYSDPIPGTLETIAELRSRDIKIAANTGYSIEMMAVVLECAKKKGFEPDEAVCASDVVAGRPAPWMIYRCMEKLEVYPPEAVVAVGDTIPDIEAGLNAAVWTIGLAKTGNMLGLSLDEVKALSSEELEKRLDAARLEIHRAGAHYVVDGISDCADVIDDINTCLAAGDKP